MLEQLIDGYRQLQGAHPLIGSVMTAQVIFPLADATAQLIKDRRVDWRKIRYTAALAPFYGAGVYGLVQSGELVGQYISDEPFTKGALGPNLWGNVQNLFFFYNNTVGERTGYDLGALVQRYRGLFKGGGTRWENLKTNFFGNIPKQEYEVSVLGSITAWNGIQWYSYAHVDESMRTPFVLGCALLWNVLLSGLSLVGRRKVVAADE